MSFHNMKDGLYLKLKTDLTIPDDGHVDNWVKIPDPSKPKYLKLFTFPLREYDSISALAKECNIRIKLGEINVSKVARDRDGGLHEGWGSVWHNCSVDDLLEFKKARALMCIESGHSLKRITKAELEELPFGEKFTMVYIGNKVATNAVVECIKISNKSSGKFLTWNEADDTTFFECKQKTDLIFDNGSFVPSHSNLDETGYLYIQKIVELSAEDEHIIKERNEQ